ncbi:MAG TPA: CHAT domain-containing protein [Abditibacteriaceae bacterium]|jgi:CHAT domain-containing protein
MKLLFRFRFSCLAFGAVAFLSTPSHAQSTASPPKNSAATRAGDAARRGDFESAIVAWQQAVREENRRKDAAAEVRSLVQLGLSHVALGQLEAALIPLNEAVSLGKRTGDGVGVVLAQNALGALYIQSQQLGRAETVLQEALAVAQKQGDTDAVAPVWNNIGNLRVLQDRSGDAVAAYAEGLKGTRSDSLRARANLNLANLAVKEARAGDAVRFLAEAEKTLPTEETSERIQLLASLATGYLELAKNAEQPQPGWFDAAMRVAESARIGAEKLGDVRSTSLALGLLGEVAERQKRTEDGLRLTRQARFRAQQTQAPHLLYRWDWQLGRLLQAQGNTAEAIAAMRRAMSTFRTLCDCNGSGFSYEETIRPLYYELADLLLQRSASGRDAREVQMLLTETRDTLELLKTAELSDYFQDGCMAGALAKTKDISTVLADAAAVYIIPLPDRTEVLLGLPTGLLRVTAPISGPTLMARARRLRLQLQRPASNGYLAYSQELYEVLLQPLEATLREKRVGTLVFVVDGALRSIPFGALHNGQKFLAEKYALAVAPGLTLLDPKPLEAGTTRVFTGGISESVQGFDALQNVSQELKSIQKSYAGTSLLDGQFVKSKIASEVTNGDFSVVHIASHGEFSGRADNTYLLTYDGKVTLDELERLIRPRQFRGTPVEMLFLSACQTAAGDDRAALGLAGIAVKAGARSAVASLWSVNDEATAALVANFYTALKQNRGISKAAAMQKAQLATMQDERFAHPAFWAPFLVIGNWL